MIYYLLCCFCIFVLGYLHWTTVESFDLAEETVLYINNLDRTINTSINPCDDFQAYVCSGGQNEHFNLSTVHDKRIRKFITGARPVTDGTAVKKLYDFYELCTTNRETNMLEKSYEKLDRFLEDIEFDQTKQITPQIFAEVIAYLAANHNIKLFMDIKFEQSPMRSRSDESENILNVKWPYVWEKNYIYEKVPAELLALSNDVIYALYVNIDGLQSFETTVKEAMIQFPGIDWVLLLNNNGNYDGVNCYKLVEDTFTAVFTHLSFKEAHQTSANGGNKKRSKAFTTLRILTKFRDMAEKRIKNNTEVISYLNEKIKIVELAVEIQKTFAAETWFDKLYENFVIKKDETSDSLYFKAQQFMAKNSIEENIYDIYQNKMVLLRYFTTLHYAADLVNPYLTPDDIPAITYGALGAMIGDQIIHNNDNFLNNYNEREFEVYWMQTAYDAFISDPISRDSVIPETLKLSNLTNKQLFFLSFGKHWCRSNNSQMLFKCESVTTLYEHVHMLKRLQNFAPFREAFICAATTKHVTEKLTTIEIPNLTLSTTTLTTKTPKSIVTKPVHLAPTSTSTTVSSGKAPIIVDNDLKHASEQRSHDLFTSNVESKVASKPNTDAKTIAETTTTSYRNVSNEALTSVTTDKPTSDASTAFIGNMVSLLILLSFTV
uniref:Peptidase_M13 domain-containing protein n=1 Tax=Panagrellus redivivus TaxID=6233 RepID=A0A7E4VCH4_PANRE